MNSQALSHLTGDGIKLISPDDGISRAEGIFYLFIPAQNNKQAIRMVCWRFGVLSHFHINPHQDFLEFKWKQEQGIQLFWKLLYIISTGGGKSKATNNFGCLQIFSKLQI